MATSRFNNREAGPEEFQLESGIWIHEVFNATVHIRFLSKFLNADIFIDKQINMFERLEAFKKSIESYRTAINSLYQEVQNHKYDLEGMRECDDISCESFYRKQHLALREKFTTSITGFKDLELQIFNYTEDLLIKKNK